MELKRDSDSLSIELNPSIESQRLSIDAGFQFDKDWETPLKRLRGLRDGMPEQERHSDAWHSGDVPMESVVAL